MKLRTSSFRRTAAGMTTAGTFMIPAAWRNLTDAGEIHLDLICAFHHAI